MPKSTSPSRRLLGLAIVAGLLLLAANAIVYMHARAFLRFAPAGTRTPAPEQLSAGERAAVVLTGVSLPRPRNRRTPAELGLAFETASVQAADGTRLEAWWLPADGAPRGRALLFHGYGGSKDQLLEVGAWFQGRGYEVGLVDFRGAGGSAGDHTTLGWEEALDVAALEAAARRRGPEPVLLYGFSMGAAAIAGAIGRLGVRPDGAVLEACYESMRGTVRNRFALMGLPASPLAELLVFWGGVSAGFDGFALRPVDQVRDAPVPLLFLHGEEDRRAPPADGEALRASAGSGAELVVLPRTGHQPGLSTRPPEWGQAVGRLAGAAAGGRPATDRAR
jgi:alpha-beta hydrolase superfamily lysophospholipase